MCSKITKGAVEYFTEKQNKLGIIRDYYGNKVGVYHRHRPIAYSTKATSDLLAILKKESSSWEELLGKIHYDQDAKKVVQAYIDHKSDFNKVLFR